MDNTHDAELIARALTGDGDSFSDLVRPHMGLFTAGIHRILQDAQDTQDALQEAMMAIHKALPRFRGDSRFSTWAYRICLNEALMMRRSRMRRREEALEDYMPHFSPDGSWMNGEARLDWAQEATALESAEHEQFRRRIQEGIGNLSSEQRAVFVLKDLQGLDTDEVARMLGISRGLVRQRLHRARLGLRGFLKVQSPALRDMAPMEAVAV